MNHRPVVAMIVLTGALLLAAAGCSDDDDSSSTSSSSSSTTTSSSSSTTSSSSSGATTSSSAAALGTAMNSEVGQQIVVDAEGKTVYLYEPDGSNTTSQVPAAVLAAWPPVTGDSATVGAGLDQTKAKLEPQPDGTSQLSYGGHLLYTFSGDQAPGDASGQGIGEIWFVLSPDGNKISG